MILSNIYLVRFYICIHHTSLLDQGRLEIRGDGVRSTLFMDIHASRIRRNSWYIGYIIFFILFSLHFFVIFPTAIILQAPTLYDNRIPIDRKCSEYEPGASPAGRCPEQ